MKVDWDNAPTWATHALTTGPRWDGNKDVIGQIHFAQEDVVGDFYDGPDEEMAASFVMGNDAWIIAEKRPATA